MYTEPLRPFSGILLRCHQAPTRSNDILSVRNEARREARIGLVPHCSVKVLILDKKLFRVKPRAHTGEQRKKNSGKDSDLGNGKLQTCAEPGTTCTTKYSLYGSSRLFCISVTAQLRIASSRSVNGMEKRRSLARFLSTALVLCPQCMKLDNTQEVYRMTASHWENWFKSKTESKHLRR